MLGTGEGTLICSLRVLSPPQPTLILPLSLSSPSPPPTNQPFPPPPPDASGPRVFFPFHNCLFNLAFSGQISSRSFATMPANVFTRSVVDTKLKAMVFCRGVSCISCSSIPFPLQCLKFFLTQYSLPPCMYHISIQSSPHSPYPISLP